MSNIFQLLVEMSNFKIATLDEPGLTESADVFVTTMSW